MAISTHSLLARVATVAWLLSVFGLGVAPQVSAAPEAPAPLTLSALSLTDHASLAPTLSTLHADDHAEHFGEAEAEPETTPEDVAPRPINVATDAPWASTVLRPCSGPEHRDDAFRLRAFAARAPPRT